MLVDIKNLFPNINLQINFKSKANKIILFGPSGSGKTLTLLTIAGFYTPKEGEIIFKDNYFFSSEKKINLAIQKRNIGLVPQQDILFAHLTVIENIALCCKNKNKINELLKKFRLKDLENKYPQQLSVGQKQRVSLARAIAKEPQLLLLDEPFSALDSSVREKLLEEVSNILLSLKTPVILVTHHKEEAYILGEHIIVLKDGKVVEEGLKDKIFFTPQKKDTARFIGTKNILKVDKLIAENNLLKIISGKITLIVHKNINETSFNFYFCIFPQHIKLVKELKQNCLEVTVTDVLNKGDNCRIFLNSLLLPKKENFNLIMDISLSELNNWEIKKNKKIIIYLPEDKIFLCE